MTAPGDLDSYLGALRADIEAALVRVLDTSDAPRLIVDAMRYALLGGGKRLRPCLTLAAAESVAAASGLAPRVARARALPGACAVEMIHTYSLVHDDLPAMDNDALRRGRPTAHVVYGDGMAVLIGDGLLTEAFAVLADPVERLQIATTDVADAAARVEAVRVLASAAGAAGMVGGQAIDLAAAGRVEGETAGTITGELLEDMHRRKTGALIRAAASLGAVLAGAEASTIRAIDDYARDLGLAFQIIDDVLDVEGSDAELGKTAGKDAAAGKPTYPALFGLTESRRLARDAVARARAALAAASLEGPLHELAEWTVDRTH